MTIGSTRARQDLDLDVVRLDLEIAETTRARQLANLPAAAEDDMVAVLHRESVERLLGGIRAALGRLDNGSFGLCTKCHEPIPRARLDLRPWTATCTTCAQR